MAMIVPKIIDWLLAVRFHDKKVFVEVKLPLRWSRIEVEFFV